MTRLRLAAPLLAGVLAAAWLNGPPLRAADRALPSDLALAARGGTGFVSVRVADLIDSAAGKEFLQQLNKDMEGGGGPFAELRKRLVVPPADIERVTFLVEPTVAIVRTVKPYDRDKLLDALGGDAQVKRVNGKTLYLTADGRGLMPVDDNVFVRGSAGPLQRLVEQARPRNPEDILAVDEALELAAGKHHVTAGVNPLALLVAQRAQATNEFERVDVKVAPSPPPPPANEIKPPSGGGGPPEVADPTKGDHPPDAQQLLQSMPPEALPFKPLLQARFITLTLDVDDGIRLEGRATYADKDLAADGETSVKTALYVLRELLPRAAEEMLLDADAGKQLQPLVRQLQESLRAAAVHVEGTTVTASAPVKLDPAALAVTVLQVRRSAESVTSSNNLKQIALAMMNFHDTYGFLPPPAICGKDGKPLLSWRVAILPFIEQQNLYMQFKLDEPWDSPNNKKWLESMPKIYKPVRGKTTQPYSTFYQVFVGPGAPFQVRGDGNPPFGARGLTLPQFADGTSNTLLVVESGEAVPWTKPDDIPFDEKKPVPPLGGDFGVGFHAALADGSVLFIKKDIDQQLLKYLIMPNDGNPIDWDKVPVIGRRPRPFESGPGGSGTPRPGSAGENPAVEVKPIPPPPPPPPPKEKPPQTR